jgi:hypothetical protein
MPEDVPEGFVSFDFKNTFPYIYWVSDWVSDEAYPDGFRYKMLTVQNISTQEFEAVLVLEERNGNKTEMKRYSGPVGSAALQQLRKFILGIEESFGVELEEQDLSDVRTAADFEARTSQLGWSEWK